MKKRKTRATARIIILSSPSYLKRGNGLAPVMLRITHNRKSNYLGMAIGCKPEQFNKETGRFRKNFPSYIIENKILAKQEAKAKEIIRLMELDEVEFSVKEFKKRFRDEHDYANVREFFNRMIKGIEDKGKISSALPYRNTLSSVLAFTDQDKNYNAKELSFKDIDYKFLIDYEHFMLVHRGNSTTTASIYMRHLRAAYNEAVKEKVAKREQYPFKDYSIHKRLKSEGKIIVLTKGQIEELESYDLPEGSYLSLARDLFLFSYYCRGINFADMIQLTPKNFTEEGEEVVLRYARQKTGHKFEIGMPLKATVIYYKYLETLASPKDFLFPIFKRGIHKGGQKSLDRKKQALKSINKNLQKLGEMLGLAEKLTTYSARHTFATIALHSGASKEELQEGMGHESVKTTEVYTRRLPSKELDKKFNQFL